MPRTPDAPLALAIETAGSACSVALGRGGVVIRRRRREMRHGHGEALLPMIDQVAAEAGIVPAAIEIVAASVGPGGFTGIRAGLAAAHGIAVAVDAKLVGVTGFAAVAALADRHAGSALLVALDSRRDDLYVQLFDAAGNPGAEPAAVLPGDLAAYLQDAGHSAALDIAGDAAEAAALVLASLPGIRVLPHSAPDAAGVLAAAWRHPDRTPRPLYLRPPDVTLPRPAGAAPTAR